MKKNLKTNKVYPTLLLVLIVCFVYAVISPFIMPAGALFFGLAYVVYKYQVQTARDGFGLAYLVCKYQIQAAVIYSVGEGRLSSSTFFFFLRGPLPQPPPPPGALRVRAQVRERRSVLVQVRAGAITQPLDAR